MVLIDFYARASSSLVGFPIIGYIHICKILASCICKSPHNLIVDLLCFNDRAQIGDLGSIWPTMWWGIKDIRYQRWLHHYVDQARDVRRLINKEVTNELHAPGEKVVLLP